MENMQNTDKCGTPEWLLIRSILFHKIWKVYNNFWCVCVWDEEEENVQPEHAQDAVLETSECIQDAKNYWRAI